MFIQSAKIDFNAMNDVEREIMALYSNAILSMQTREGRRKIKAKTRLTQSKMILDACIGKKAYCPDLINKLADKTIVQKYDGTHINREGINTFREVIPQIRKDVQSKKKTLSMLDLNEEDGLTTCAASTMVTMATMGETSLPVTNSASNSASNCNTPVSQLTESDFGDIYGFDIPETNQVIVSAIDSAKSRSNRLEKFKELLSKGEKKADYEINDEMALAFCEVLSQCTLASEVTHAISLINEIEADLESVGILRELIKSQDKKHAGLFEIFSADNRDFVEIVKKL